MTHIKHRQRHSISKQHKVTNERTAENEPLIMKTESDTSSSYSSFYINTLNILQIELQYTNNDTFCETLFLYLKQLTFENIISLISFIMCGFMMASMTAYSQLWIYFLGGTPFIVGISILSMFISQTPSFFYFKNMLHLFTNHQIFIFCFIAYGLHAAIYAMLPILPSLYFIILAEIMHGFTYAVVCAIHMFFFFAIFFVCMLRFGTFSIQWTETP